MKEVVWYAICLSPIFPNKKLYKDGAFCITKTADRFLPNVKSLNMLQSYLAYREAKNKGAYDSLLINHQGNITEGSRTNFFCMRGRTIYTQPDKDILLGVTRDVVLKIAQENDFKIEIGLIRPEMISSFNSAFLTSTSSKIIPIFKIDDYIFKMISQELKELMQLYDEYLKNYIQNYSIMNLSHLKHH